MPPLVRGVADLTTFAYHGNDHAAVLDRIGPGGCEARDSGAGLLYDLSIACQLDFRRAEGLNLQDAALERSVLFRVRGGAVSPRPLRVLAVAGAGELMVNTPLDFLTSHLDVRLDILHVLPGRALPEAVPDHDVAFFAHGDPDPGELARLCRLFRLWPRPALNDPRFLPGLGREALSRSLAGAEGILSPAAVSVGRAALLRLAAEGGVRYPCLLRPAGSHAGAGLVLLADRAALAEHLLYSFERSYVLTAFEDYAGADGLYRKSRVAFIDREPFLCHMAVSRHWMVHYLNAGMTESAEKRAEEAAAMAGFDTGFARRHRAAFEALHARLGFDLYSIDCAEARDGRLLVFEADAAAIVHLMDPEDMFPYKHPHMRRVFDAFGAMLQRRAGVAALVPA